MKKEIGHGQESDFLREKAKDILNQRPIKTYLTPGESELISLNSELQIHQIELEIINNQLTESLAGATKASNKYIGLFDFAPIGYFTVSTGGEIIEINLNGAQMLGKDRSVLINKRLLSFISEDTRMTYALFFNRVIETKIKEECELILLSGENSKINVHVSGIALEDGDQYLITMVDITEHIHDKTVLKNSLALTEATLNSVHNGILVVNWSGKVLKTNTKFVEMWHIPDDILASGDDNTLLNSVLGHLADPDEFLLKVTELYNSPDMSTFDYIQFKDGHIFERISKPMYIDGKPEGRVWSFLDITARIKANTDLQKALWRMESILHGTQAGTWEWNVVTGELIINEMWADIIGYRLEELAPVDISTWQKYSHPDDLQQSDALLQQHFDGKLPYYDCECRMKHKDGHWIWIHDRGMVVSRTNDGGPLWMFGTHTEITQRKNAEYDLKISERNAKALLNAIPDLMFKLNNDGVFLEYKSAKEDLAYQTNSIVGIKTHDILPNEFADLIDEKIGLTLGSDEMQIFEYRLQLPVKGICDYEARMVPGNNNEVITIVRDITERKTAESEIKSKNEELSKLVAEKDKFFSIIAHDLRSPFNGFLGLTELMVEDMEAISPVDMQELALGMRDSAINLFRLLENLLEWARMEQGLIPFNPVRLNLREILSGCIDLMRVYMNRKRITIVLNVLDDFIVKADQNMLETIIRNLISNAIKFTQIEGEIVVSAAWNSHNLIRISVKDSGIGMNPKMVDQLFELSAKNGRKGTAGEPSTGLGLIICKEFVEKHGGKIWVDSVETKGSTFYFTMPH